MIGRERVRERVREKERYRDREMAGKNKQKVKMHLITTKHIAQMMLTNF